MVLGYAADFSVVAGTSITLHFASNSSTPPGRIHVYRWGLVQGAGAWIHMAAGKAQLFPQYPRGEFSQRWGWPAYPFSIPPTWKSGVYVAVVLPATADGTRFDPETRPLWQVLFVVRNPSPGRDGHILYKVPFFTYAAYNGSWLQDPNIGAMSLYQLHDAVAVTALRPGIGVDPWDSAYTDFEDTTSNRQTFQHWDAKMVAWLEANEHAVDYCTDLDIHRDASLVSNYCLLLSVGHDEYWSEDMRHAVEAFIRKGGNVAFFSGDTSWWRLQVTETQDDLLIARLDNWPADNLETRLTGVSYRHGDGKWSGPRREGVGYTVQYAKHWVYAGTGLADGDDFAADDRLVGYECDGAQLLAGVQPRTPTFADGTPLSFVVLGFATTPAGWDAPTNDHQPTMGVYTNGGIVFTAATTDWPRVLAAGQPEVTQITRNVLARLNTQPLAIAGPTTQGACNPHVGVAGAEATFYISNVASGAKIKWHTAAGTIVGKDNLPVVVIRLPNDSTQLVTVSVSTDALPCPGFGTLSFRPLSAEEFGYSELLCHLRHLTTYSRPLRGSEDKLPFVDPIWDPPPFDGGAPIALTQLRVLRSASQRFLRAVDRALAVAQPRRTSSSPRKTTGKKKTGNKKKR